MTLKKLRLLLKALAEDTRLRIVNLLSHGECTVKEICTALKASQPAVSKHLARLRLLKIVNDRREGNCIYYSLNKDSDQGTVIRFLLAEFRGLEIFKKDSQQARRLRH